MSFSLSGKLVVAISSRALFDFEEENRVFEATNDSAYMRVQQERLAIPAKEGVAFPLVEKLLKFNTPTESRVEVVILSRNDPVSGLRVFRSAEHAGLKLERGVFTRGRPPYHYLRSLHANLFLSANEQDVRETILAGFPAALVYPQSVKIAKSNPNEVRIAFVKHETHLAKTPLPPGPFKPLLEALQQLQNSSQQSSMKIRTALVTARSAPTHERAIRTLMSWGIDVDEAMFLGGLNKSDFLREFAPDFFFDDQTGHCEMASEVAPTGQVISGITNQRKE
jgi:5'-nucleotidase